MLPAKHNARELKPRRRGLRAQVRQAEAILWRQLQRRQLCGPRFRRQHSVGPYVLDFYCPEAKLAVELDGAAHDHDLAFRRDAFRTAYLAAAGVRVIRFKNDDVMRNLEGVLAVIERCCAGSVGRIHALSDDEEV
jgi:very-short-patch-repair endonuclease